MFQILITDCAQATFLINACKDYYYYGRPIKAGTLKLQEHMIQNFSTFTKHVYNKFNHLVSLLLLWTVLWIIRLWHITQSVSYATLTGPNIPNLSRLFFHPFLFVLA